MSISCDHRETERVACARCFSGLWAEVVRQRTLIGEQNAEIAEITAQCDRLEDKLEATKHHCACEYDQSGDTCLVHTPKVVALTQQLARAKAALNEEQVEQIAHAIWEVQEPQVPVGGHYLRRVAFGERKDDSLLDRRADEVGQDD